MPERFKPYSSEEAWNEAELLKKKRAENEKLSYADAERDVALEKVIESAKNGELAEKIKNLDLSKEDDIEELRIYLKPWYQNGSKMQKILDGNGKEIFQFDSKIAYILEVFRKGYFSKLKESDLVQRGDSYGHEIYKSTMAYLEMSNTGQDVKKGLESTQGSDKFFDTVGAIAKFTATSMNGGLPGSFIGIWGSKIQEGELTKNFVETHPNYQDVMNMAKMADCFFETLFEVFTKFLSNKLKNPDFTISGVNSEITPEQVVSDFDLSRKIFDSVFRRNWASLEKEALEANLSESVAEQVRMFTEKIGQYQKVLDEFNERLKYAKPQVKDKE